MNKRIVFRTLVAVALLLAAMPLSAGGGKDETSGNKQQEQAKAKEQAQTLPRLTDPLTEANFEFIQNSAGGITITKYKEGGKKGIRDLVIPAQILGINVTEIARNAFANGRFTDSRIEYRQFDNPEVFESVTIPSTVVQIGMFAFAGRGIKTLTLPEGLRGIGSGAFAGNQLTSVTLPASLTDIFALAFAKNQLTSINIPAGVKEIDMGVFGGNKLTKVTIPAGIRTIGACAFASNQLTELTIPEGVTTINAYAFANNMISELTFSKPSIKRSIGDGAFAYNRLKSLVLPEISSIAGTGDFGDVDGLTSYFDVRETKNILSGNPLGYIKIPSLPRAPNVYDGIITLGIVPAFEWESPRRGYIPIAKADAVKVGANIDTGEFDQGFNNFYASQGKKAGIYMRRGPIWVTATQEEFDAFIAEKTK